MLDSKYYWINYIKIPELIKAFAQSLYGDMPQCDLIPSTIWCATSRVVRNCEGGRLWQVVEDDWACLERARQAQFSNHDRYYGPNA